MILEKLLGMVWWWRSFCGNLKQSGHFSQSPIFLWWSWRFLMMTSTSTMMWPWWSWICCLQSSLLLLLDLSHQWWWISFVSLLREVDNEASLLCHFCERLMMLRHLYVTFVRGWWPDSGLPSLLLLLSAVLPWWWWWWWGGGFWHHYLDTSTVIDPQHAHAQVCSNF